jgi:hypothetical protein
MDSVRHRNVPQGNVDERVEVLLQLARIEFAGRISERDLTDLRPYLAQIVEASAQLRALDFGSPDPMSATLQVDRGRPASG